MGVRQNYIAAAIIDSCIFQISRYILGNAFGQVISTNQHNNNLLLIMELSSCSFCGLQYQQSATVPIDLPVYQSHSDSIKLLHRRICKPCNVIVSQIENFAVQNNLAYCNYNFKSPIFDHCEALNMPHPRKSLQFLFASSAQQLRKRSNSDNKTLQSKRMCTTERTLDEFQQESIHPYIQLIVEQLLQKNYLAMAHLPKTLQFLIHLSSKTVSRDTKLESFVSVEERHEKVKNVILYLAEMVHLSIQELPYCLFLVNFLFCFMDSAKVASVIIQISNILITYPHLLSWKTLILEQERSNSQAPLSPATFDFRTVLVRVDKLMAKLQSVFQLASRGEAALREGIIRISKIQSSCDSREFKKKTMETTKSLLSKKEEIECMSREQLNMLYLVKLERNSFGLILRQFMQEQESNRQHIAQLQHKFKMEKDQFIDKIVKLNNRIEELQNTIDQLGHSQSQKAENMEIHSPISMQHQQNTDLSIELQNIITFTDLFAFNDRLTHEQKNRKFDTIKETSTSIVQEILTLQNILTKSQQNLRTAEEEKNRLLGIISRKEERLLGVILEKDTIIQRYEQALWTMENGLEVREGPIAHRIKYIMHIFQSRSSQGPLNADQNESDSVSSPRKGKDKDCVIY